MASKHGRALLLVLAPWLACTSEPAPGGPSTGAETTGRSSSSSEDSAPPTSDITDSGTDSTAGLTTGAEATTGDTDDTADTSFKPICGDGVLAGDEICDDGNLIPEDGCDECMPAITVVWDRFIDGPLHHYDLVQAVATNPAGEVFAVGYEKDDDDSTDLTVRKFTVDGRLSWEQTLAGSMGGDDYAYDLAVTPDGGAVVVGGLDYTIWVRRYGPAGEVVWTNDAADPMAVVSLARGVVIDGDAVFVAANQYVEPAFQVIVRQLDLASGATGWQQAYIAENDLSANAYAMTLADDTLFVAGGRDLSDVSSEVTLQRWSTTGTLKSTWAWSAPGYPLADALSVTTLSTGESAMAVVAVNDTDRASYLVIHDEAGSVVSADPMPEPWANRVRGVATDSDDHIVLVGWGEHPNYGVNGFLGLFTADGSPLRFEPTGFLGYSALSDVAPYPGGLIVGGERYDLKTDAHSPRVELITTDGFLLPNAALQARGLMAVLVIFHVLIHMTMAVQFFSIVMIGCLVSFIRLPFLPSDEIIVGSTPGAATSMMLSLIIIIVPLPFLRKLLRPLRSAVQPVFSHLSLGRRWAMFAYSANISSVPHSMTLIFHEIATGKSLSIDWEDFQCSNIYQPFRHRHRRLIANLAYDKTGDRRGRFYEFVAAEVRSTLNLDPDVIGIIINCQVLDFGSPPATIDVPPLCFLGRTTSSDEAVTFDDTYYFWMMFGRNCSGTSAWIHLVIFSLFEASALDVQDVLGRMKYILQRSSRLPSHIGEKYPKSMQEEHNLWSSIEKLCTNVNVTATAPDRGWPELSSKLKSISSLEIDGTLIARALLSVSKRLSHSLDDDADESTDRID